jgi:hypothetical protein
MDGMLFRCDRSITVRSGDSETPGKGAASIRSAMTFGGVRVPRRFRLRVGEYTGAERDHGRGRENGERLFHGWLLVEGQYRPAG